MRSMRPWLVILAVLALGLSASAHPSSAARKPTKSERKAILTDLAFHLESAGSNWPSDYKIVRITNIRVSNIAPVLTWHDYCQGCGGKLRRDRHKTYFARVRVSVHAAAGGPLFNTTFALWGFGSQWAVYGDGGDDADAGCLLLTNPNELTKPDELSTQSRKAYKAVARDLHYLFTTSDGFNSCKVP